MDNLIFLKKPKNKIPHWTHNWLMSQKVKNNNLWVIDREDPDHVVLISGFSELGPISYYRLACLGTCGPLYSSLR